MPIPYALCEDASVVGTSFYIMEFLQGRIFDDVKMPELEAAERREWCVLSFSTDAAYCLDIDVPCSAGYLPYGL